MTLKYSGVVFDFDSTIISIESLDMLAEVALEGRENRDEILAQLRSITERGMNGEISIDESLKQRLQTLGANRKHLDRVRKSIVQYLSPSFKQQANFFKSNTDKIFIVSGGFDQIILEVSRVLEIPDSHVYANTLLFDADGVILGVDMNKPLARAGGKAEVIKGLGIVGKVAMVGDGYTDFEAKKFGSVDSFVYYAEHIMRETVAKEADYIAKDLTEVIGYIT